MFKIFSLYVLAAGTMVVSIYSLSVPNVNGASISFNDYRGKKILVVNTASGSNQAYQLTALQELYAQHQDSLVVIAFPSNSFGNEPLSNQGIKNLLEGTYGTSFPVAEKSPIKGDSANVVYKWLADKIQNEVLNARLKTDFQKFLIDKTGSIVGVFDSSIVPTSTVMQAAIQNN